MPENQDPDEIAQRVQWFANDLNALEDSAQRFEATPGPHRCPCCGYMTLKARGAFEICPVCFWEDDGQDDHDAAIARGGPNGSLSLTVARMNYRTIGVCEERFLSNVRNPLPDEL